MSRRCVALLACFVTAFGVHAGGQTSPTPAPGVVELASRHELAVGDVIAVTFPRRPDFDREATVLTDGQIVLPLAGTVRAAGRTPEELQAELRRLYAPFTYDPSVRPGTRRYLISVEDVLDIRFRDAPQLNQTVHVRPDGRISLPLVKSVTAEGKTPEDLETELIDLYAAHLVSPDLVVMVQRYAGQLVSVDGKLVPTGIKGIDDAAVLVRSYSPRQVYVTGEVRNPGFVTYRPPLTAMQAIVTAGGLLNSAASKRIILLRKVGEEPPVATFLDLNADLKGQESNDVPLRPFDMIVVPKTRIATINQFLDQYLYQLLPATRNVNFTFFYELSGTRVP